MGESFHRGSGLRPGPRSQQVESTAILECSTRLDHRTRCEPRTARGPGTRVLTSALDSSQMRADEGDESELGRGKRFVLEMKQNTDSFGMAIGLRIGGIVSLLVIAGCSSTPVEKTPPKTAAISPPVPQLPDESWSADAYVQIGMPNPGHRWTAKDYGNCRNILYGLDRTNRTALPRSESLKSGGGVCTVD